MDIFPTGTKVTTIISNIDGVITGASIKFETVLYEVGYFYEGEYKSVWLNECEFTTEIKKSVKVGFK